MRKLLITLMVVGLLVTGCAGLFQTVCTPTTDQQAQAQMYKAEAQALLSFLQTQISDDTIQTAIAGVQAALAVYDQVITGVCEAADVIQTAVNSVNSTKTMAMTKMGYKG